MRILHVCPYFKPSWEGGGPPRFVYDLASQQVAMGHDVTVYTSDGFKKRVKVEKNTPVNVDGIRTYYFRNLSIYLTGKFNMPLPYYLPVVALREIKTFDVIHIHEHRTFLAVLTSILARRYNIPYIVQPHGSAPRMTKSLQKKFFDKLIGNKIIYNAKRIIASSSIESKYYIEVYPKLEKNMITRLPNPVNIPEIPDRGSFKRKWGLEKNKIIIYLGRIHEKKGLDLLVKAFHKIKNENLKLVIIGPDDHYLGRLKKLISDLELDDRILLTGPLYDRDKFEALVDADVFILPSKEYESFGMAAAEAIACGTPVIVTSNCGISEWMEPSSGLIVEADEKKLRNAMMIILENPERFHPQVPRMFKIEKIANGIEEIYKDAINGYK
ncbi:MAG TPA: glycosyltransferase [Methanothermobacter sp.]|nr:glycosyltransferase [Methanothermobacter sp.]HOK72696.1 glycosyltransferase [Methanothermobacter sp.]HOL68584.1 glycosyltransferase [Methanothermobacter sp.]HPQ04343.1 glycosyltransferase [Methanothermobacter sp.]HPU36534.1 glycosyltransferase [Methanothermobacter sp.]